MSSLAWEMRTSNVNVWELNDDVAHMVLINEADGGVKDLQPMATHAFNILREAGVPDMGIQHHTVEQMKIEENGVVRDVATRYNVTCDTQTIAFIPKELTEDMLSAELIKRAALGACMLGKFDKLPRKHARVTWEVQKVRTHPAHFKPIKPKVWLMNHLHLKVGIYYTVSD